MRQGKRTNGAKSEEPFTEFSREDSRIQVKVQLPGISETRIRIELDNHTLVVSAGDRGKEYRKEIALPWTARIVRRKYRNEILELVLERAESAL